MKIENLIFKLFLLKSNQECGKSQQNQFFSTTYYFVTERPEVREEGRRCVCVCVCVSVCVCVCVSTVCIRDLDKLNLAYGDGLLLGYSQY